MVRFLLILLCTLYTFGLMGQGRPSVSGRITYEDGSPAINVTVKVEGTDILTISDTEGRYVIPRLRQGQHILIASSLEIETKRVPIDLTQRHSHVDFVVNTRGDQEIEEVAVLRNTVRKDIETSGFAVSIIETEKAAIQSIQTNELLDRSAGVRIRQNGGLGSNIQYNINGLSGNAVRIFIDGIPASNYGSAFSLNSIPPALIERIEVYKGVVPGHLSEDALGGAINIVLKQQTKNSLVTSYSVGSFNTHQWNATGNFQKESGFKVNTSAFYNYSDNSYEVWGREIAYTDHQGTMQRYQRARRFNDGYESYGARAEAGYSNVKWADQFLVGGVLSRDYKEIQHGITMGIVYGDRHTRRNSNVATLNYAKQNLFVDGLSLKVDASYSYIKRQAIDTVGLMYDWRGAPIQRPDGTLVRHASGSEVGSQPTLGVNSDKTFLTRANLSYLIASGHTLYANYMHNNFVRGISDELRHPVLQQLEDTRDLQKNILAVTYESLWFSRKLKNNLFYKHYFQRHQANEPYRVGTTGNEYGMNVTQANNDYSGFGTTFAYEVTPNIHILASAEKAIRLLNADEIFGNINDNLLPPAGQLDPETSYNANIGVNWSGIQFGRHSLRLNSTIFLRDTRGMIREAIRAGSNEFSQFENLENVMSRGIDGEIIYNFDNRLDFNFTISKFDVLFNTQFDERGAEYRFYRTQIRNEPSFKFNTNIAYTFRNVFQRNGLLTTYYNINYVEGFLRNWANVGDRNIDIIPTQFGNDIGLAYTLPSRKATLSFDAKNIFDQQIFDNFGLQKPGRSFFTKLTYVIF